MSNFSCSFAGILGVLKRQCNVSGPIRRKLQAGVVCLGVDKRTFISPKPFHVDGVPRGEDGENHVPWIINSGRVLGPDEERMQIQQNKRNLTSK